METLLQYKDYAIFLQKEFPQHKDEIIELWVLAKDEIESGESANNETGLFLSDVEELTGFSYLDYRRK